MGIEGTIPNKVYLRPNEVWKILDISKATFYNMISEGVILATKVGGQWRIPRAQLVEYLTNHANN